MRFLSHFVVTAPLSFDFLQLCFIFSPSPFYVFSHLCSLSLSLAVSLSVLSDHCQLSLLFQSVRPFVRSYLIFILGLCSTRFIRLHNHAWLRRYVPLGVTGYSSRFEFSTLYNRGTFYVGISNLSATQTNANRA